MGIEGYILVFVLGACVGSFLNVCIHRLPTGGSILRPRSHCPGCKKPIMWYDNVPLLSFIILRARCRSCGTPIPFRYLAVELITPISWLMLFNKFGFAPAFFVYALFVSALIVITFIDFEHGEIPDEISIPGIFVGIAVTSLLCLDGSPSVLESGLYAIVGVAVGGAIMAVLGAAGSMVFKKDALGGGDIKLMAMIGAFIGWKLTILTFFIAPILGSGVALYMKLKYKAETVPYGPYLALGAMISVLWGEKILGAIFGSY
jgi:leader peptidase (prepilin peptidase)/N-methyltransferase